MCVNRPCLLLLFQALMFHVTIITAAAAKHVCCSFSSDSDFLTTSSLFLWFALPVCQDGLKTIASSWAPYTWTLLRLTCAQVNMYTLWPRVISLDKKIILIFINCTINWFHCDFLLVHCWCFESKVTDVDLYNRIQFNDHKWLNYIEIKFSCIQYLIIIYLKWETRISEIWNQGNWHYAFKLKRTDNVVSRWK